MRRLAKGQPTTWRALAIQDYLTPPIIVRVDVDEYTGKAGERIDVFVQDATCQRVKVTVLDPTQGGANALGAVVEEGEAQRAVEGAGLSLGLSDEDGLSRTPNQANPFRLLIEAEDLPGKVVTHTVDGEL
jgi:hypothetical protein